MKPATRKSKIEFAKITSLTGPRIGKGSQDLIYTETLQADDASPPGRAHTLRISIRSDSYRAQCWAKIERHDGMKWHTVETIEPSLMTTPEGLCYAPRETPVRADAFMRDRNELIRLAGLVLVSKDVVRV